MKHKTLLMKVGENLFDLVVTRRVWSQIENPGDLYDLMETVGEDIGELVVMTFGLD